MFDSSTIMKLSLRQSGSRAYSAWAAGVRSPSISRYASTLVSTRVTLIPTAADRRLDVANRQRPTTFQPQRLRSAGCLTGVGGNRHADLQQLRDGILELLV